MYDGMSQNHSPSKKGNISKYKLKFDMKIKNNVYLADKDNDSNILHDKSSTKKRPNPLNTLYST